MAKSTERVVPLEPTIRDYDEYLINNMGYISSKKNGKAKASFSKTWTSPCKNIPSS
jgi:hypothetical protein